MKSATPESLGATKSARHRFGRPAGLWFCCLRLCQIIRGVRREFWAYADDERLSGDALITEAYRGIRPAPGYPACPDHTAKGPLFALLDAQGNAGMRLTESYAMLPASSVSGFYLSHPQASYFAVGRIGKDQVEDYARRKGVALTEAERWLATTLAYDPQAGSATASRTASL